MKIRFIYIGLSLFFLGICFLILHSFRSNVFIRGFMGDMTIVMLIYTCLQSVKDFSPAKLSASILLFSFGIETLQYFKILRFLGVQENDTTKIIFGSIFDPLDLVAYFSGTILILWMDVSMIRKHR
ncbi:DUF2809 domain-containing protein [Leptospira weilii]|uniref:ribosomal maturation YjgA family protein n=1 Tax=Leptospira weilii TaxID=28184 RepID=UPI00202356DA|nr:DUF2809 domain-containing protein [Leptospira weilii]MCL8268053.1 DUF2809 domain-containing protein [Leptospira weilii]